MRAAVYHGAGDLRIEEVDDAEVREPTDAVVDVVTASMCGSDLYLYGGEVEDLVAPGRTTLGHEVCGIVSAIGSAVARFRVGDRVTPPYSVSCGTCPMCRLGQTAHCETSGKAIYGYGIAFGDLGGSHAEHVRVPLADGHLEHVPSEISDEAAVFLSCNLPAAVIVVDAAVIGVDDTVAVVGCGPTGLLALELARRRTAREIFAIDPSPFRRSEAARRGATPLAPDDAADAVEAATSGRGVDRVLEIAGRGAAFDLAVALARPGGLISGGGVYLERDHPVSLFDLFFKNLDLHLNGFANARTAQWQAMELLRHGVVDPEPLLTERVTLSELPGAAARFAAREDGVLKLLVRP
ncbi:MAG: alcohol dehydrogenase catalytic domain-containing protein [Actinomycetota bacterium]|jgi:alcohol dehydrogenase|nr:alcohol dehydrogenase catalytic domain-containing protein [Actinomycetota bacterium]